MFRAAAGPRCGFGHLVRCGALANALAVHQEISLRGPASARRVARDLGWTIVDRAAARLAVHPPELLVVDDPSAADAARWVRRARQCRVPVATVHDLGLTRVASDLTIDGGLGQLPGSTPADLQGPEFAILDPIVAETRARRPPREPRRVLITLGGGAHVRALGARLARRIARLAPDTDIDLAAGFSQPRATPNLPPRCQWIDARSGLSQALATASVAVVAGGVTLSEACALGTPIVTIAVTPQQRIATRAVARTGAAIDASAGTRAQTIHRTAADVAYLLANADRRADLGARARQLVDGLGASRVVRHLHALTVSSMGWHRRVA
jgi:spore coat polysaccharide biosynthesis predicted glycosyltransferase SpsG